MTQDTLKKTTTNNGKQERVENSKLSSYRYSRNFRKLLKKKPGLIPLTPINKKAATLFTKLYCQNHIPLLRLLQQQALHIGD